MQFVELPPFEGARPGLMTDAEFNALKTALADNPQAGDVIRGTGGFRKIRWANEQRGKGKRGGSRTIYLFVGLADTIFLYYIYDHEEQDDLSSADRRELAGFASNLKKEAKAARDAGLGAAQKRDKAKRASSKKGRRRR